MRKQKLSQSCQDALRPGNTSLFSGVGRSAGSQSESRSLRATTAAFFLSCSGFDSGRCWLRARAGDDAGERKSSSVGPKVHQSDNAQTDTRSQAWQCYRLLFSPRAGSSTSKVRVEVVEG